jgi:hypothetical protein
MKSYSNYFIVVYRKKLKLVLVLFNFSEVFKKVPAGPTDGCGRFGVSSEYRSNS